MRAADTENDLVLLWEQDKLPSEFVVRANRVVGLKHNGRLFRPFVLDKEFFAHYYSELAFAWKKENGALDLIVVFPVAENGDEIIGAIAEDANLAFKWRDHETEALAWKYILL